ncbi:MAG: hypothetical protein FWG05_05445, partial [Kiritimatiellaeota bacterium]|nr:hypothetical protein [Kiritimatiellota bacterium]
MSQYPTYTNVIRLNGDLWIPKNELFDSSYLIGFFNALNVTWPKFQDYKFIVHKLPPTAPLPEFPIYGPNVILIILSDQSGRTFEEEFKRKFFAILRTHLQTGGAVDNVLPFPLGDSSVFDNISPPVFATRKWEAGFIGNRNANRLDLYRSLTIWKFLPPWPINSFFIRRAYSRLLKLITSSEIRNFAPRERMYFTFTSGFAQGLPPDEYGRLLADTKIVVCPKGFIRAECYRIFEGMRMGCIVIADELPEQRWYTGSPIIIQKNWLGIHKTIRKLCENPDTMQEIHRNTLAWWETVCSPSAVAEFLTVEFEKL